jgi:hypothetical protein
MGEFTPSTNISGSEMGSEEETKVSDIHSVQAIEVGPEPKLRYSHFVAYDIFRKNVELRKNVQDCSYLL